MRRIGATFALLAVAVTGPLCPTPAGIDVDAWKAMGGRALRDRDYPKAEEIFARIVDEKPKDADAWMDLGRTRSAMQAWDGAIAAYERTIELQPKNEKAYNNLGNVYFRMGVYDEAGTYYDRALELDPAYVRALFHSGYVLLQQNRRAAAGRRFQTCLDVPATRDDEKRTQFDCHFYQGVLAYRADRLDDTVAIMERILQANPAHAEALHYLAQAYRRLGRVDDARQAFERHKQILKQYRGSAPIRKAVDS